MNFNYYHGTSTIFLESIRQTGLGTINPNTDLKNLDVLKFLFTLCEEHLSTNKDFLNLKDSTWAMVHQSINNYADDYGNKMSLNYRHDGIYVAISRERAAIYAALNRYGSEILERCIQLYKLLTSSNVIVKIPPNIDLFNFRKYIDTETKPIIIEIRGVKDEELETEDGKKAEGVLDFLRKAIPQMTEKVKFETLQYSNFKLLKPVPPERLKFFELEYEGHPAKSNFEFVLCKI